MNEKYRQCPLQEAGFALVQMDSLGPIVFGPDGRCICTRDRRCRNPDKRTEDRCTISELERLNSEARARRAYQAGED